MSNNPAPTKTKAERLAQSAFYLGAGSIVCGITAIPASVQSIRSLLCLKKEGGRREYWWKSIGGLIFSLFMFTTSVSLVMSVERALRANADDINCVNHLKDLAVHISMYQNDNGDTYPPLNKWCDALQENATNQPTPSVLLFQCPAASKKQICGYAIYINLKDVKDTRLVSSDTVVLFESDAGWNGVGGPKDAVARHYASRLWVAFADGSVNDVRLGELEKLRWIPSTNVTQEYPPGEPIYAESA